MVVERDFRVFLQNELVKRCNQNGQYSLRAFAKFLRLEPSALSKILHGKRSVSKNMFLRLAERLNLSPTEIQEFQESTKGQVGFQNLELEVFEVISQWYYFAILELTHTENFKSDVRWISKVLGITVHEAHIAVERLMKLKFLEVDAEGKWRDKFEYFTTLGLEKNGSIARRRFQKQLLEKAMEALQEVDEAERDQTSLTFAMNPDFLPEARKKIKDFRRKLLKDVQSHHPKQEVYQLVVSLFPLTKVLNEK